MLQFTASTPFPAYEPPSIFTDAGVFFVSLSIILALVAVGVLYLARGILRGRARITQSFDRCTLEILVPKERKSEGQEGRVSEADRLEQIKEEIAMNETFFATLAGLRPQHGFGAWLSGRSDHITCEMIMHEDLIRFYINVPLRLRQMIEQQIHAQYPHAEINLMSDYNIFSETSAVVGAYITGTEKYFFPIKTYKTLDSDPLSSLLNVLARAREKNSGLAVQFVLRPTSKHWRSAGISTVREVRKGKKFEDVVGRGFFHAVANLFKEGFAHASGSDKKNDAHYQLSPLEEEMIKGIEQKITKGGLDVTIRLLSISDDREMAKHHLDNLINAFSQYNVYRYGNSLKAIIPRQQSALIRDFIYRSFHDKRKLVLNTEEITSLWHLPLHSTEAPNIKWLGARRAPPPPNVPKSGLLLGHTVYRGIDVPIHIKDADRRRHMYIIGKSGVGKSVLISNLAIQDIQNGHGVCVVDPHGDLVEDILRHIPKDRADDVIIFNPSDIDRPIGLNMLEAKTEDQKDFAVQEMIAIFYKLFPPEMIGPMFEHNMRNVMLTLMADLGDPGTVIDIPRMFTDDEYVKKYLKKLRDPVVRAFWEKEMAKTSDFHKSEMLGYLISKVGRFVENEMMRNIMGQQQSGFDFRRIMDEQKILLVNLSKGTTGEVNAKLLGLIIVAKLQMAALGRADMSQEDRKDFYLYIDEFQNFITDSISTILSEARKYKLNLIIAHQYMGQLTDDKGRSDIRDAVLGNAGTMCSFRIGPDDAEILAKEFAPTFGSYDLMNVPQYTCYTKLLIDNTASRPFNMLTYPLSPGNKQLADALKQLSRLKYGRDRDIVEAEIMERTQLGAVKKDSKTDMIEASL